MAIPATGVVLIGLLAVVAYLSVPSATHLSNATPLAKATALPAPPSTVATGLLTEAPWLEEKLLLRADEAGTVAVHPEGEVAFMASGGDLEVRPANGDWTVRAGADGGWQVRATRTDSRGEIAVWCGQEVFSVRLRSDLAAPLRRRLWMVPPTLPMVVPAATATLPPISPSDQPDVERASHDLLDELIQLESRGPGGEGSGEYGQGQQNGLGTHWRRCLRRGDVCGAVVDLICQQEEPFFYEPSSIGIDLPGRGAPEVLVRSSFGMVLPGKSVPALVIWYDPLPPGATVNSPERAALPAGPFTLHLHPWALPWRDLAALSKPVATALPVNKPRRR